MNVYGFILETPSGSRYSHRKDTDLSAEGATAAVLIYADKGTKVVSVKNITSFPMWDNCLYKGNASGHSHGFCTANACY